MGFPSELLRWVSDAPRWTASAAMAAKPPPPSGPACRGAGNGGSGRRCHGRGNGLEEMATECRSWMVYHGLSMNNMALNGT